ncbi:MAG: UTP--glucose-phosphate uridylyltransferase, partial [Patescibacteria group bacterium]|nr:UTP--glucose-phosphate uridylyltransferase [Patescibacteria group bacterium]
HLNPANTGKDAELWTVDAITKIAATKNVKVVKTQGKWLTTGDPENYFRAYLEYVIDHEKYGAKIDEWIREIRG